MEEEWSQERIAELLGRVNEGLHVCMRCGAYAEVVGVSPTEGASEGMITLTRLCSRCGWSAHEMSGIGPLVPSPAVCLACGGDCVPGAPADGAPAEGERAALLHCERCGAAGTPDMVLLPFQPVPALEDAREKLLEWTSAREFHRALALANYILVHDFQNEIAWEAKQAILEHMGFSSSLRAMLEEAVARGGPVSLNRVLGQELLKVGRFDEAIRAYRAYLASEERFGRAAVCLGLANALRQKDGSTPADREEARRLYQQAVSHEPETLIYRLALAAFLGAEGRSAAALEHLERAESIARTPEEQCEVLRQTGEIYRLLGDWGRAEQVCTRALALVPDRIEVLHLRAFVRGYLGEFARAGEDVDRLLALAPDHEAALGMRQALEQIRRANP